MPFPSGRRLDDGHPTTILFSNNPTVALWEKEVTPPGIDGGEPVDTTTMRNVELRTKNPRKLKEITTATFRVAFDEGALLAIMSMINQNQQISVIFPTGRPWTFWGYLKSFKVAANTEGKQPEADCELVPTMQNATGLETGFTVGTTTSSTSSTTTTS
jgi:hypothetical protein